MNIYKTLQIGEFHTNYCEDFLIIENISETQKMIAVLDGCTMGKESVFASILYGKILRNIAKKEFYKNFVVKEKVAVTLQEKLKTTVSQLFSEVKIVQQQLDLTKHELLSTLIIGVIDITAKTAVILIVGDGLVVCNKQLYDFEQEDKPDYLGYHLNENFETWYKNQKQVLSFSECKDLSIATDGIFTFKNLQSSSNQKTENDIINHLLINTDGCEFENILDRKLKKLKEQENHVPTDDLAIVRIIF